MATNDPDVYADAYAEAFAAINAGEDKYRVKVLGQKPLGHTEPQSIPTIDERTASLIALFEAALAVKPWDLTLAESYKPGVGLVLIAWAKSRGVIVEERHYVTDAGAYANVEVRLGGEGRIIVLNYRKLTADEIAAITVENREREAHRIGYGKAAL